MARDDDARHRDLGRDLARNLSRPLISDAVPASVECPFCRGSDTELFSAFGSALSVSQYYCRPCRSVFEWMKWR